MASLTMLYAVRCDGDGGGVRRDGGGDVGWAGAGNNGDGGDCSVLGIINYTLCKLLVLYIREAHV